MLFRPEIGESLTLKFAGAANERRKQGLPIISLGLGEPEFQTPEVVVEATVAALRSGNAGYSSPTGLLPFREKLAEKLSEENDIPATAANIIVTAGAKQAFQIVCMALLQPEDEVIIISPSFVSFIPQLYLAEPACSIQEIVVDSSFRPDLGQVAAAISEKTRLVVINSPNNPAGFELDEAFLEGLFALSVEHDFMILSDEIYEKIRYGEGEHFSIGSYEKEVERVITINGFSKSHAMAGWRLGYACIPPFLQQKVSRIMQHTLTNTNTFIQKAMVNCYPTDDGYLKEYNQLLKKRMGWYTEMLAAAGLKGNIPEAGFFAFMPIGTFGMDSNAFSSALIAKTGVATTPGVAFGKDWDDHIRISLANSDDLVKEGLDLIGQFIEEIKQ